MSSSEDLDAVFAKATDAITAITNDVRPPAYRKAFGALLEVMGALRGQLETMQAQRAKAVEAFTKGGVTAPTTTPVIESDSRAVAEKLERP